MLFLPFPKDVPGWCFYFKLKSFDFLLCIPFIIVLGRSSTSYNLFTDENRIGISFSIDHLSFNWKGEPLFFWDFANLLFGEHISVVVRQLPGGEAAALSDGVWSGYPAIVGYRRKRLRHVTKQTHGFVLTMIKGQKVKPYDQCAIDRHSHSLTSAIQRYRSADYLFAMLNESEANERTE